jgi:hypothetical protein
LMLPAKFFQMTSKPSCWWGYNVSFTSGIRSQTVPFLWQKLASKSPSEALNWHWEQLMSEAFPESSDEALFSYPSLGKLSLCHTSMQKSEQIYKIKHGTNIWISQQENYQNKHYSDTCSYR